MDLPHFGYFSGNFVEDGKVARMFKDSSIVTLVVTGLSSSFSAHGLRLGHFSVLNFKKNEVSNIYDLMGHITRNTYNFYPRYPSDYAKIIL